MANKAYIGIDPGSKGFIALHSDDIIQFWSLADNDYYKISDILKEIKTAYPNVMCVMESVHALYGSSAKATFSFGEINGLLKGLLIANKIPYSLVEPKKWQAEIWDNKDIVASYKKVTIRGKETTKKEINTKLTSLNSAKRLYPHIDFRKTDRCKNFDDNKVDSLLLATYALRKNL